MLTIILCIFNCIPLESRDQDDNNEDGLSAAIIGGAVGGASLLIATFIFIFVCIVIWIWLRKHSKQEEGLYTNPQSR